MNQQQQSASNVPGTSAGTKQRDNAINSLRAFDLQINDEAVLPGNPHSLSDAELILDALAGHRNKIIAQLQDIGTKMSNEPGEVEGWRKYFTDGEFLADLAHIKSLSTYIDIIAGNSASTLRIIYRDNARPLGQ